MRMATWLGVIVTAMALSACGNGGSSSGGGGGNAGGGGSGGSGGTLTHVDVPATWPCGTTTCHKGQICVDTSAATAPPMDTFACADLPTGCDSTKECGCMDKVCMNHYPGDPCGCDATSGCQVSCVEG